jgi:hypothetical protein
VLNQPQSYTHSIKNDGEMADQQVSPLETAPIQLELISFLSPESNKTGLPGTPSAADPPYDPPRPTSDAWNRVGSAVELPIGARPALQKCRPLPATVNLGHLRREEKDQRVIDSLNRYAFSTFIYQPDPHYRAASQSQHVQVSSTVENPLSVQRRTAGNSTSTPSAPVAHPSTLAHPFPEVQHVTASTGLGSGPSFRAFFAAPSATLPQLPPADEADTGSNMQAQVSQDSTVPSAPKTGSSPSDSSTMPSLYTPPENSSAQRSVLFGYEDEDEAIASLAAPFNPNGGQNTTSTTVLSLSGAQPSLLVVKVESSSDDDLNGPIERGTVKSHKRQFDIQDIKLRDPESSTSSSYESDFDPELGLPQDGFIRDRITGRLRKRIKLDDFDSSMRTKYRQKWNELCGENREDRGPIDGYEEGDSDLEFSDWEKAKKERRFVRRSLSLI